MGLVTLFLEENMQQSSNRVVTVNMALISMTLVSLPYTNWSTLSIPTPDH